MTDSENPPKKQQKRNETNKEGSSVQIKKKEETIKRGVLSKRDSSVLLTTLRSEI